jgi:hypothetical protein
MSPAGGGFYTYVHSGAPIEAGWRQADLYRDDNGKRTLIAEDVASDRYYKDEDCLVYTTGHGEAQRATSAACGKSGPLTFDTRADDYWRMDADGLRANRLPDIEDGVALIDTVSIDDIKAAVVRGATLSAKMRPINPNFVHEDTGRTLVMDVVDPGTGGGSIQYRLALLQVLVAHGANVSAGDRQGVTPLMIACHRDDAAFIEPLIEASAVVNTADNLGRTPLMIAAGSFRTQVTKVQLLLDAGANVKMRDAEGRTAAERVRTSSDAELLSLLKAS